MTEKKLELLAPAGSYEIFQAVLNAGADAVYVGGSQFGARAYANNFSEEELLRAIDDAHIHGKQLYLTVNTLLKEDELNTQLYQYLLPYYRQGLDAVIVQDMGAFSLIREYFPDLDIHTSTQMTVANRYGAQLMKDLGANRVVTAREMSFAEIKDISDHVDIEIESFIHGALCYCYSGQCLLSSMLGGRSGNRGRCAQPCRLPYEVYDEHRKKIPVGPYILSPKDLCTIESIPQLAESGIYSFKIEGRMKQAEYAAGVVSIYRKYIDRYLEYGAKDYKVSAEDNRKLFDFGNRSGFTSGYYEQHNGKNMITFQKPNHAKGNEQLQDQIRNAYCNQQKKEKIKGILTLSKDLPAMMEVSLGNVSFTATGNLVQPALKQPLSAEKIRENAEKTGNTPFEFAQLHIDAQEDIFLPMKALNQLRRDALSGLEEKLVLSYRRKEEVSDEPVSKKNENIQKSLPGSQKEHYSASVESRQQLAPVLTSDWIEDVYLDPACYSRRTILTELAEDATSIHAHGKRAYMVLPTVFRKNTSDFYLEHADAFIKTGADGVLVKSYDALAFVLENWTDLPVILDQGMYSFNSRAIGLLRQYHPLRLTAPFELNRHELSMRDNTDSELLLYGYLPLMTSAQCVHANALRCDKERQITWLKDRYGKFFPVKNHCFACYNTIYNSTPLILFGYEKDLKKAGFSCYRISFTIEKPKEVEKILSACEDVFVTGRKKLQDVYQGDYTNGHYKRGVE